MEKTVQQTPSQRKFLIHEDWTVVIIGFLIIAVFIVGLVVPVPSFSWSNSEELLEKVLSRKNLFQ